ncbi:MAG: OsmC family protein [Limnochordia bacterium]|nr:OsmC family protein [Limnochordia bacterium]
MAIATFTVGAHSVNPTQTVVRARNFEMIIDEPSNLGGTDEGPTPVEYILGALAGCLTVVGHVVAKEMAFELRGITFELAGDLDPAKFLGESATNRAGFQEIRVKVLPDSNASQEQLDAWLKAVGSRCPVSDNLANTTPVQLTL